MQLNEEPAWTRSGTSGGDIVLLDEHDATGEQLSAGMKTLNVEDREEDVVAKMKALAIERGDGNAPSRSFGLADLGVRENTSDEKTIPLPPTAMTDGGAVSGAIEGYLPKHQASNEMRGNDSDDGSQTDEDLIETI